MLMALFYFILILSNRFSIYLGKNDLKLTNTNANVNVNVNLNKNKNSNKSRQTSNWPLLKLWSVDRGKGKQLTIVYLVFYDLIKTNISTANNSYPIKIDLI